MLHQDCARCQKHLDAYVHGELSKPITRWVASHLRACDSCYTRFKYHEATYRRLSLDLRRNSPPSASQVERMWQQIQTSLNAEHDTLRATTPAAGSVPYAVALVLMLALILAPGLFRVDLVQPGRPAVNMTPGVAVLVPAGSRTAQTPVPRLASARFLPEQQRHTDLLAVTPGFAAQPHSIHRTPVQKP